ncbi:MAG: 23S rRNA (adenine(2503)-C(2))-methyltransferase RlmN [Bacteroidales bacterium]
MQEKANIRKYSLEELVEYFLRKGRKKFRAKQVYEWLWTKGVTTFDQMTNLSSEDREELANEFFIQTIQIHQQQKSSDGTIKLSFKTYDNYLIEGVLIPAGNRTTACISSQIGCKLNCSFCATGTIKFKRNLTAGEIFDQVQYLNKLSLKTYQSSLSNIVYMGMGEPLLNYREVMQSINYITEKEGMNFSPKRITLSTVGLPDQIKQLADNNIKFNLAVSLHSAIEKTRSKLVPVNKKYNLEDLKEALKYFHNQSGKRITFEYLMLEGINDSLKDAKALAEYCKNFPVKINLIEYNPYSGLNYNKTKPDDLKAFQEFLEKRNMIVKIRKSRGQDIDAACGQLAGKAQHNG